MKRKRPEGELRGEELNGRLATFLPAQMNLPKSPADFFFYQKTHHYVSLLILKEEN